jgi:hypothetical protein
MTAPPSRPNVDLAAERGRIVVFACPRAYPEFPPARHAEDVLACARANPRRA